MLPKCYHNSAKRGEPKAFYWRAKTACFSLAPQLKPCSRGGEVSFRGGQKLLPFSAVRACWAISVGRIFDWKGGGAKPPTICNEVIRNCQKKNFLWGKNFVDWKIRSRGLCLTYNQDFAKGRKSLTPLKSVYG